MKSKPKNIMSLCQLRLLALLVIVPILACGCAIDPERMVPNPLPPSAWKVGNSVRVMDVTGGTESFFGGAALINNEQFKKALTLALEKSGLFNGVSSEPGNLDLYATIRSEQQNSVELQYTTKMLVSYKFVDRNKNVVWSASCESEFSSRAFSGATRTLSANEGSARENSELLHSKH